MKYHKIGNTVWQSIDDSQVNLDTQQIEKLFKAKKKVV